MTFELTGEELYTALECCMASVVLPFDLDFVIMCSGMGYSFDLTRDEFQRVTAVWVGEEPLDPEATYTFTSSIALPTMMEQLFPIEPHNLEILGTTLYEVFKDYCIENSPISANSEGRVLPVRDNQDNNVTAPAMLTLSPAFPNPFNGVTSVEVRAGDPGRFNLTVFDISGREVARLANGQFTAGSHGFSWNAAGYSTGVYMLVLESQNRREVQRLVLLK